MQHNEKLRLEKFVELYSLAKTLADIVIPQVRAFVTAPAVSRVATLSNSQTCGINSVFFAGVRDLEKSETGYCDGILHSASQKNQSRPGEKPRRRYLSIESQVVAERY